MPSPVPSSTIPITMRGDDDDPVRGSRVIGSPASTAYTDVDVAPPGEMVVGIVLPVEFGFTVVVVVAPATVVVGAGTVFFTAVVEVVDAGDCTAIGAGLVTCVAGSVVAVVGALIVPGVRAVAGEVVVVDRAGALVEEFGSTVVDPAPPFVEVRSVVEDEGSVVVVSAVVVVDVGLVSGRQNCTPAMSGVVASVFGRPVFEKRDA
ncbi:MAG: hypothetical protein QOF59_303 [Actinomycetota bacterium]|jgi:hypothetical protein|nr:hypothetical protein [Actinomycetota bacterium]MDQ1476177.1 hypothetical protein [Actinomycetota bacterium]